MSAPSNLIEAIRAIEAHLASHPLAADSADGVARWWVAAHGVVSSASVVEQALAMLVRQRRLRQVQLADGNTLYCGAAEALAARPTWRM
jgi:hypothetical protein